jgi:hypothetical protein
MDAADIVIQGAAAAGFAKILVDLVKVIPIPSPSSILPILAFIFSEACAFLLAGTKAETVFNRPTVFIVILIGIAATAGAMGATALQSKANKTEERVDAALAAPAGTTKAESDASVFGTGDGK